jgi:phosphotransferase system HPr-like phosphotransfer protein
VSPERSLEEVIQERAFVGLVQSHAQSFFRLTNTLLQHGAETWSKRHLNQLVIESDALESFLDDYGARYNRTWCLLRELTASVRWISLAAFSLAHLTGRLDSYSLEATMSSDEIADARRAFEQARTFLHASIEALLKRLRDEGDGLGLERTPELYPEDSLNGVVPRQRLPRNVGQEDLVDESQRIAEVASKYLTSCDLLEDLGIRRIGDAGRRREFLERICTEAKARVYEATVHNLQSSYDTYVKNSVVEGRDDRLPRLRGHLSAALHLLEAVTFLTHFVERHEGGVRLEVAEQAIGALVDRGRLQEIILNDLLSAADRFMQRGRGIAEELLRSYTNLQELRVELPDELKLHARPAALIVGIVGHYGTPVELEVAGHKCNAGSILEMLVTVGSNPDARCFVFRGDENPLRDIGRLFESGLGERGLDKLPERLGYLRGR